MPFNASRLRFCILTLIAFHILMRPCSAQEGIPSVKVSAVRYFLGEACYFRVNLEKFRAICLHPSSVGENYPIWVGSKKIEIDRDYQIQNCELYGWKMYGWEKERNYPYVLFSLIDHPKMDVFISCGIRDLYLDGQLASISSTPATADQMRDLVMRSIIFPSYLIERDLVRFAVMDSPLIGDGEWWLGERRANMVREQSVPEKILTYEVLFDAPTDHGVVLTLVNGSDRLDLSLNQVRLLSRGSHLVAGSCVLPVEAHPGDVICIGTDKYFLEGEGAILSSADDRLFISPLARTSSEMYVYLPDFLRAGKYTIEAGATTNSLIVFNSIGGAINICDCVVSKGGGLPSSDPHVLTAEEIKRWQRLVEESAGETEHELLLMQTEVEGSDRTDRDSFISRTTKAVNVALKKLSREPILMGLVDYIKMRFDKIMVGFSGAASLGDRTWEKLTVLRAAFASSERKFILKERALSLLGQFRQVFADVRSQNADPVVTLEVRTVPTGASFVMFPKSYEAMRYSTLTNGRFVNVWIGIYHFKVSRPNFATIESDDLNLVDDRRPVLVCPLVAQDRDAIGCNRE